MTLPPGMFQSLQARLVEAVRKRVQSGELTERSLGRSSGISQPHIHNVLKGAKFFSDQSADQLMRHLNITVLDLLEPDEFGDLNGFPCRELPILARPIGAGHPLPDYSDIAGCYPSPQSLLISVERPLAGRAAADPCMHSALRAGDLVLLDRSAAKRSLPSADGLYLVDSERGCLFRRLRRAGRRLYMGTDQANSSLQECDYISLDNTTILDIVKAKIVWIGREMEHPDIGSEPAFETGEEDR